MKNLNSRFASIAAALGLLAGATARSQETKQENNYADLAARVVKTSAGVKPGDVVVVAGGKHNVPVMEELAIQAAKEGGLVQMFLYSDRLARALWTEVPEKFLGQPPTYYGEWLKHIDVYIALPGMEDEKAVFADVPQERLAKAGKASQGILDPLNASGVRHVFVGYPTRSDAARNQLDFATYQKAFWAEVGADYQEISEHGNKLKQLLQGGKTVRVTSPSGTDFTFSLADRPILVDDGIMTPEKTHSHLASARMVSLPSGTVALTPVETSANGRVFVPRHRWRSNALVNESFDFKNGHLENYKAERGGENFGQALAPYGGAKDVFAWFQIGLNPAAKIREDPGDYRPEYAAGLVTIGIGDNEWIGGKNKVEGFGGFNFPIVNATVTIDGKTVVRDGKLTL